MYTLTTLMKALNVERYPKRWENIFDKAADDWYSGKLDVLTDEYIDNLHAKYDVFPKHLEFVKKAAAEIRSNEKLALYVALLCEAMRDKDNIINDAAELDLPEAPKGEPDAGYNIASIFSFFQFADSMASYLIERNVPQSVVNSTVRIFETFINQGLVTRDKPYMPKVYLTWGQKFIYHRIIRVERFNLEFEDNTEIDARVYRNANGDSIALVDNIWIHRSGYALGSTGYEDEDGAFFADITETDEYYEGYPANNDGTCKNTKIKLNKSDWKLVLKKGDKTISVHIPSQDSLDPDYCTYSLEVADKIFKECFSDYEFKAYYCFSWLLEPQLKKLLNEKSKIVHFQNRFNVVPTMSDDQGVFGNVFHVKNPVYSELSENTSLQRAIKNHYLNGNHLYEYCGYFFL